MLNHYLSNQTPANQTPANQTQSPTHIVVLHNPKSGARHAVDLIDSLLRELSIRGLRAESFSDLDAFQDRVKLLSDEGRLKAVIAAGGDGTAAAVATRIESHIALRVFPLGTENLLSKYFHCDSDPVATANAIDRLNTRKIDAASANGRLFLIMAGIGFDAEVVRRLHLNRKGHIRRWHYWWHILASTINYRFPKLRIMIANSNTSILESPPADSNDVSWLFVQNLPCYADRLTISADAIENDGLLNLSSFRHGGVLYGLYYLLAMRLGYHPSLYDFKTSLITDFRVEQVGPGQSAPQSETASYQIDGDWGGYLPVDICILRNRVTIII